MAMLSAPSASMVAADAQLSGATTCSFLRVPAQQVDEPQRGHAAAAVGLHEQGEGLLRARLLQDLVQRHHVVVADRSARGRPVGQEAARARGAGCA